VEGRKLREDAASFRNCAFEVFYKHPWSTHSYTRAIAFLPPFERGFFDLNLVALPDQFIHEPSVQALTMRGQLAR